MSQKPKSMTKLTRRGFLAGTAMTVGAAIGSEQSVKAESENVALQPQSRGPRTKASNRNTNLRGYCYPLSPNGKASILDDPPWHFGGDILFVSYRAEPAAVGAVLPEPLELGSEPGRALTWVAEITCCGDATRDMPYRNPARTRYVEGMVAVSCRYHGKEGIYVPYIWVDQDWSMARGWWFGWPKKLADVWLGAVHPVNPGLGPMREGVRLSGLVSRHGLPVLRAAIHVQRRGQGKDVPRFGHLFCLRHVPNVQFGQSPDLQQLLRMEITNYQVGDVWTGDGELEFFPHENEELEPLRPRQILGAVWAQVGWTNPGAEVLSSE
ncbi:MAG: acetoacetate decarboxylase family protein [Acidobacteria bacterium]|nr:acetoacetate decarboxylase family protein [Acidobacteriota bacterium]